MKSINHLAVWFCVVLSQVLMFLWYKYLGSFWVDAQNLTISITKANSFGIRPFIVSFIGMVIGTYLLALILLKMNIVRVWQGALLGTGLGFAYYFLPTLAQNMFSYKPLLLSLIDGSIQIITLALSGSLLSVWRLKKA